MAFGPFARSVSVMPDHDHTGPGQGERIPLRAILEYLTLVRADQGVRLLYGLELGGSFVLDEDIEEIQWVRDGFIHLLGAETTTDGRAWNLPDFSTVRMPGVVAELALTGQAAAIGTTTLVAGAPAGLYCMNAYAQVTTAATAGALNVIAGWTDDVGATTDTVAAIASVAAPGRSPGPGTRFFRHAGGNITYATTLPGLVDPIAYRLDLSLGRLK